MSKNKILMCPPNYFSVDYVINPWMSGLTEPPDIKKAHEQWNQLKDNISQYADIEIIEPQPDLPDMVFTANAGVVSGNKAIAYIYLQRDDAGCGRAAFLLDLPTCTSLSLPASYSN